MKPTGRILMFLALTLAVPTAARAITITLDQANQTVAVPATGTSLVNFSGTVDFDTALFYIVNLDNPSGIPGSLQATLNSSFLSASMFGFNYTGILFSVAVPSGTTPGGYGFASNSLDGLRIEEIALGGAETGGSARFSVDVISGGSAVPEGGSTAVLLAIAAVGLAAVGRKKNELRIRN